jgi:hypothetical protein
MCKGSLLAEWGKPDTGGDNSYANEGTALHAAMEFVLDVSPEVLIPTDEDARTVIGQKFNNIEITVELYNEKIAPALRAFADIIEQYDIVDYLLEIRGGIPEIPGAFGTIDILGLCRSGAIAVLDWKFGDGIYVDAVGSYQLRFYAGCALFTDSADVIEFIDDNPEWGVDFNGKIIAGIIQPRRGRDEDVWRIWEISEKDIFDFIDLCKDAVSTAVAANPPFRAGPHCWKCRNELTCEERQKIIGGIDPKIKPEQMDVAALAAALHKANQIESWIKTLRAYAHKEAERGVKIPGYKLVDKRATRVYSDEEKAKGVLMRQLKKSGAYTEKLISPAQAEKKLGKAKYNKLLAKYTQYVSSGTTLADEHDKRQEISTENRLENVESLLKQSTHPSLFDTK